MENLDLGTLKGMGLEPGVKFIPLSANEVPAGNDRNRIDPEHRFRKHAVKLLLFGLMNDQAVSLVGPSGCGKTRETVQLFERMNKAYLLVSCHEGLEAADLFGYERVRASVDGSTVDTVYIEGPLLRAMRSGAAVILEERDSLAPTVNLALNNVLDGMGYTIPETGEHVIPTEGFGMFATANTAGAGDESGQYVTSHIQARSANNRWMVEKLDYLPEEDEVEALMSHVVNDLIDRETMGCLVQFANATRESAAAGEMEQAATTRELVQAIRYGQALSCLDQSIATAYFNKLSSSDRAIAEKHWSLVFDTDHDGQS